MFGIVHDAPRANSGADDRAARAVSGLRVRVAEGFWARFAGLMFSRSLPEREALLLPRCPSVHSCFMRYAIDVVYLDRRGLVTKLVSNLQPWRASLGGRDAAHALELAAGSIQRLGLRVDDDLNGLLSRIPT